MDSDNSSIVIKEELEEYLSDIHDVEYIAQLEPT
jgi:hypothetical protein